MNPISFIEGILVKLSILPGLQFLGDYVTELHGKRTRRQQTIDKYKSYVQTVRGVGTDVTQAAGGSKKKQAAKSDLDTNEVEDEVQTEDDYEDDDYESYML